MSPGEVVTLFTTPLGVPDAVATTNPLPNVLSGVSVLVRVEGANDTTGYPASLPILRVATLTLPAFPSTGWGCSALAGQTPLACSFTMITVQIPVESVCVLNTIEPSYETCATVLPSVPPILVLNVQANGVTGPDMQITGVPETHHLLTSCDSVFGAQSSSTCQPLVTHADGTSVTNQSPAKVGETIVIYGVGFGAYYTTPGWPATGYASTTSVGIPAAYVAFSFVVSRNVSEALTGTTVTAVTVAPSTWSGLVAGYVGLYQMNVVVPPMPNTNFQCNNTFPNQAANVQILSDTPLYICVQP